MSAIRKSILVAHAQNGTIGRNGVMPWRLSTDLKRVKALTIGKPIIVGRKTFESFPKPLPGRPHVVVSRQAVIDHPQVSTVRALDDAFVKAEELAKTLDENEIFILGGGEIYRQSLGVADRLYVTYVDAELEGDAFFPELDPSVWKIVEQTAVPAGEKDDYPTQFVIYDRA